jgi:hypothetical protein
MSPPPKRGLAGIDGGPQKFLQFGVTPDGRSIKSSANQLSRYRSIRGLYRDFGSPGFNLHFETSNQPIQ